MKKRALSIREDVENKIVWFFDFDEAIPGDGHPYRSGALPPKTMTRWQRWLCKLGGHRDELAGAGVGALILRCRRCTRIAVLSLEGEKGEKLNRWLERAHASKRKA
jgi:hypothetical protein